MDRPRVGISRCLLGDEVRYDGGHERDAFLVDTLGRYVEWVPVCPEVDMGMGTPREAIHLVASSDGVLSGYVLKEDSQSCGLDRVRVHAESSVTRGGRGLFAQALVEALPNLPVEEDGRLHDPLIQENFIARVFAFNRLLARSTLDPHAPEPCPRDHV